MPKRWIRATMVVAALVLALAACGDGEVQGEATSTGDVGAGTDGDGEPTGTTDPGEDTTDGPDGGADGEPEDASTTGSTAAPDGADPDGADSDEPLPGDPFDIGPPAGERLDVVGVAHDDVLNFRARPNVASPVRATVAPLADQPVVLSQGQGRLLVRSAWWFVTVDGQELWANVAFLGMLGESRDVFGELDGQLDELQATSVAALAGDIAGARAGGGPEPTITFASDPAGGSGSRQVVVDILGYGDDALKGERFTLTLTDDGVDPGFALRLVAARAEPICGRGVSNGACV